MSYSLFLLINISSTYVNKVVKYFSLFQVKRVVKFALNETNNFTEITTKKCIMDVKLIKKPRRGSSNDKTDNKL